MTNIQIPFSVLHQLTKLTCFHVVWDCFFKIFKGVKRYTSSDQRVSSSSNSTLDLDFKNVDIWYLKCNDQQNGKMLMANCCAIQNINKLACLCVKWPHN